MQNIVYDGSKDDIALRDAFARAMSELIDADPRVVYFDADLMSSMGMAKLKKQYPENVMNCGIQEANMIGVAAGMAAVGKIPFAHSFGIFATRRCYDQIFLSAAYANNSVRIIGSDEGISAEYNGGTHMPLEDMALIRAIPNARVIDITDCAMMYDVTKQVAYLDGLTYIRTARKASVRVYGEGSKFEIGKGVVVKDGGDVTIIACGLMVPTAIEAAAQLEKEGVSAAVIDMFTVKPLDEELVEKYAKKTRAVVTAENHRETGGLGSAVCEYLCENLPTAVERVAVFNRFGEVGPMSYLRDQFHLNVSDIVEKAKKAIKRK